jgi:hypothetical protein
VAIGQEDDQRPAVGPGDHLRHQRRRADERLIDLTATVRGLLD